MRITRRQLRKLIKETVGEMRSEEAISHAASQREDGMSFKDFAGIIVDRLNLYDEWLDGEDPKDVADWYTRALDPAEEVHEAVDTDGDGTPDYLDLDSDNDGISDSEESGEESHVDLRGIKVTPQSIARLKRNVRRTSGYSSGPSTENVPVGVRDPRTGRVRTK
jgi:hypothetical protein|tara:strand:- start:7887 stop:8378 length:492 start_codon:yes stop_codon:yes gene_type:complete